jgi:transcriptional regulator with PAS, ATPase and Fis domain
MPGSEVPDRSASIAPVMPFERIRPFNVFQLEDTFDHIIGESAAIKEAERLGVKAARSRSPILLLGETGAGKEPFAHRARSRSRSGRHGA